MPGTSWGTFAGCLGGHSRQALAGARARGALSGPPVRTYPGRPRVELLLQQRPTTGSRGGNSVQKSSEAGDTRPDPVGGIRSGDMGSAPLVDPWGDRQRGAFVICGPGRPSDAPRDPTLTVGASYGRTAPRRGLDTAGSRGVGRRWTPKSAPGRGLSPSATADRGGGAQRPRKARGRASRGVGTYSTPVPSGLLGPRHARGAVAIPAPHGPCPRRGPVPTAASAVQEGYPRRRGSPPGHRLRRHPGTAGAGGRPRRRRRPGARWPRHQAATHSDRSARRVRH